MAHSPPPSSGPPSVGPPSVGPPPAGKKPVTGHTRTFVLAVDRAVYWFSKHWLAVLNSMAAIYVGLPILAPMLMAVGATRPGQMIYTLYRPLCHQKASASLFLFGEQYAYPREMAGTDLRSIDAYLDQLPGYSDVPLENWLAFSAADSRFTGNSVMGYKIALCIRDIGIYGFVLVGGLLYGLLARRRKISPLPFWLFLIIGMGPIGLDGFSQLFGYLATPLDGSAPVGLAALIARIFPLRESTPFLRFFTGAWFGLMTIWLLYPHLQQAMTEMEQMLEAKLSRVK
jgi:uncharacterized membrane protein